MNCKMILLATAALVIVAAGVFIANSDDSNAEVAYTYTSGNCTVDLETREDGNYDIRVYKTPGAADGKMADYTSASRPGWYDLKDSLISVSVEDGVESIGSRAFANCVSVKSVTLPHSITHFGDYAFSGCDIQSFTIPSSITTMGQYVFYNCASLREITLEYGISRILGDMFKGTPIQTISIPSSVTAIGAGAFQDCTALKSVTIPGSVNTVGTAAFRNCVALKDVTLEHGLTELGSQMFLNCPLLKTIIIPSSVTEINPTAFQNSTLDTVLNLSGIYLDPAIYQGISQATIKTSIDAPAFIEQSDIKSVVIGPKDDAASNLLCFIPVAVVLGIILFLGVTISRKYDLFD